MNLTTYPLDDIDYTGYDASLFHCTRNSGIYAGDDFTYSVSGADNSVKLSPGIAWMRLSRFKGMVSALKTETVVDMGLPDSIYPRLDRLVLQFDANKNAVAVVAKKGTAASNPNPPERFTTEALFELHLLQVRRNPGAVSISAADVTDLRMDSTCCGLMADSVTSVDTSAISAQIAALLEQIQKELLQIQGGTAVEIKKLQFTDVNVDKEAFQPDTTSQSFPYRAAVALSGALSSMVPDVMLSEEDAMSGNFSPVARPYDGGLYLYAASPPDTDLVIPTILLWRGNV